MGGRLHWLDGSGGKAAKAAWIKGVTALHPLPEERPRGEKSPQWSAVGRVRLAGRTPRLAGADDLKVRHAALRSLGCARGRKWKTTRPPSLISGRRSVGLPRRSCEAAKTELQG